MYVIMSETFTEIDSHFKTNLAYEPAKDLRYKIHCFNVMLMFAN